MVDREAGARQAETEPRPAAVTFVTTEHFTLQGAAPRRSRRRPGRRRYSLARSAGGWLPSGWSLPPSASAQRSTPRIPAGR